MSEDKKIPSPPPPRPADMEERGIDTTTVAELTIAGAAVYTAWQQRPKKPPPPPVPESPIVLPPGVDKE